MRSSITFADVYHQLEDIRRKVDEVELFLPRCEICALGQKIRGLKSKPIRCSVLEMQVEPTFGCVKFEMIDAITVGK